MGSTLRSGLPDLGLWDGVPKATQDTLKYTREANVHCKGQGLVRRAVGLNNLPTGPEPCNPETQK